MVISGKLQNEWSELSFEKKVSMLRYVAYYGEYSKTNRNYVKRADL